MTAWEAEVERVHERALPTDWGTLWATSPPAGRALCGDSRTLAVPQAFPGRTHRRISYSRRQIRLNREAESRAGRSGSYRVDDDVEQHVAAATVAHGAAGMWFEVVAYFGRHQARQAQAAAVHLHPTQLTEDVVAASSTAMTRLAPVPAQRATGLPVASSFWIVPSSSAA